MKTNVHPFPGKFESAAAATCRIVWALALPLE
jgi:hypothetical protein